MGWMRGRRLVVVLLVALGTAAAWPLAASADETLVSNGSFIYTWHGDAARGCAAVGVCGMTGALVVQPRGAIDLATFGRGNGELNLLDSSVTVRVRDGNGGTCVDQQPGGESLGLRWTRSGSVTATFEGMVTSGRCAGPLAGELQAVPMRGRRSRAGKPSFDLRATVPFGAGPYSGTYVSTVVLRPAPPSSFSSGSSSGSVTSGGSSSAPKLSEQVDLRYRLTWLPGALAVTFAGEAGPFCVALDSCGARGSLTLSPGTGTARLELFASRTVRARVGRAQALRDFVAGRLGAAGGPPVGLAGGNVTETVSGPSLGSCSDSLTAANVLLEVGGFPGGGASRAVPVGLLTSNPVDPLRTHCPGPEVGDVFGGEQPWVVTRISRRQLLERSSVVSLAPGGSFSGPGYAGGRGGAVRFSLTLVAVLAGTQSQATGP